MTTPKDSADVDVKEDVDETSDDDSQNEDADDSKSSPNGKAELEKEEESDDSDSDDSEAKADEDKGEEEEEESESDTDELDDEVIEDFSRAYQGRIMGTKAMQEAIGKAVQSEVSRQVASQVRGLSATSERETRVAKGKTAVTALTNFSQSASDELGKASRGEEFQADVFDSSEFIQNLRVYGEAIKEDTQGLFEGAIEDGFNGVLTGSLASLVEAHQDDLTEIVRTHEAMRGDPSQSAQAEPKFVGNMVQFIVDRATELGALQERERAKKGKAVSEKIVSSNAVKAARAKLEAQKDAPNSPKSKARKASGGRGIEDYEKARDDGEFDLADEIFAEMMS